MDKYGNHYFSGFFFSEFIVGNDSIAPKGNAANIYVMKVDSSGTSKWAGAAHSANLSPGRGIIDISHDGLGNTYLTGNYEVDPLYFGQWSVGGKGKYAAKIKPDSSVTITLPKDTIVFCGDSLELQPKTSSVAALYYQWSPGLGLSDSTIENPYASPDFTTTYTVSAYSSSGCSDISQITVHVDSFRANSNGIYLSTSTGGNTFCNNNNLSITTPSGYSNHHWSDGTQNDTLWPKGPGKYYLTAADSLGCYHKDSITINAPKTITAPNKLVCQNDSVSLFINSFGLDSLRWSNGHTGNTIYAKQAGKYWVTIYRANCIYTDTVDVSLFTDTANARFHHKANLLEVEFSPISIGVATGRWSFGDGTFSNSIIDTHTYAAPGTYLVCFTATDICGFTTQHCDSVTVSLIGLPEIKQEPSFSIYPNPTNGILNIESSERGNHQMRIVDLTGKVLLNRRLENDYRWEINLRHLPQGYYFIRIDNQTRTFVKL